MDKKKLNGYAIHIDKADEDSMDVTVWSCFGNFPNCPYNCDSKTMKGCQTHVEARKCLVIVEERDIIEY